LGEFQPGLNLVALDAELLGGLAAGGVDEAGVVRFGAASGKTHLPRVMPKGFRTLGEDERGALAAASIDEWHQDSGWMSLGGEPVLPVGPLFGLPGREPALRDPSRHRERAKPLEGEEGGRKRERLRQYETLGGAGVEPWPFN
jgi:hypothetical protein